MGVAAGTHGPGRFDKRRVRRPPGSRSSRSFARGGPLNFLDEPGTGVPHPRPKLRPLSPRVRKRAAQAVYVESRTPDARPGPHRVHRVAELLVVPLHRHHLYRRAKVHRLRDRLESRCGDEPPAAGHERQKLLVVELMKGKRVVVGLHGRRVGAVPEAVETHVRVLLVPTNHFVGVAAIENVHQEKRFCLPARLPRQLSPQKRRKYREAGRGRSGDGIE